MHEFGIARSIMKVVLEEAERNEARKVSAVELLIGTFNNVVPDALLFSLEALAKDTIAEGAAVRITREPVTIECRACGKKGSPEDTPAFLCPHCGGADVMITGGRALALTCIEVED